MDECNLDWAPSVELGHDEEKAEVKQKNLERFERSKRRRSMQSMTTTTEGLAPAAATVTTSAVSMAQATTTGSKSTSAPPAKRMRSSSLMTQKATGPARWSIGMIGAGSMARAIAEGLIGSAQVSPSQITASATSAHSENLKKMRELGVNTSTSNSTVMTSSDIIIIAVKPHLVLDILSEMQEFYVTAQSSGSPPKNLRPVIVSVAAAITISDIETRTSVSWQITGYPVKGHLPVIRCLPTLGCSINSAITVYSKGRYCNEDDMEPFLTLFSLVSTCEEVDEKYLNAFTAFSGSGLAFMSVALEALADGGVMAGIPRAMSQRVAAHTLMSAAQLVLKRKMHPAEIKDAVASPSGTTIAGLECLENGSFRGSLISAVKAANKRADELNTNKPKT